MPNDAQRIQRALEVFRITGTPLSSLQQGAAAPLPFAIKGCALMPERPRLHEDIAARFDAMLHAGLVEELKDLRRRFKLTADLPSMRAVGYRQAWAFLEGECDEATMRSQALAATRQLAKRQVTWLRSFPDLVRLEGRSPPEAALELNALITRSCRPPGC
jgi:tRNA dimethylallyltransferase